METEHPHGDIGTTPGYAAGSHEPDSRRSGEPGARDRVAVRINE